MSEWKPSSPAQSKALASSVYELLYGGAAGGGKSEFLLIDAIKQIDKRNYKGIMMRNTFPELEKSLILKSHEYYPSLGGRYNSQLHRWTFPSGAIIEFGYSENDLDIQKYKSAEYAWIGLDEATTFTPYQIDYIISRNRCPDRNIKKRVRYATNPTGRSHAYFKKRFINGKSPYTKYTDDRTGLDYMFIPALARDNRILMENDPDYVKRMERLPEKERKALLYGSWDIFEGQYFGEWNSSVHVVTPYQLAETYPRFICLDYGYTQPSAVYWVAVNSDSRLVVYREIWGTGYTYETLGQAILKQMSPKEKRMVQYVVADPAIFTSKSGEKSGAEVLQSPPFSLYLLRGNNKRIPGWTMMRQKLAITEHNHGIKTTGIEFFNTCANAIRTIPQLMHDNKRPEDCDTKQKDENGLNMDDPADAIRYGIMSRYTSHKDELTEQTDAAKHWKKQMKLYKEGVKKKIRI